MPHNYTTDMYEGMIAEDYHNKGGRMGMPSIPTSRGRWATGRFRRWC